MKKGFLVIASLLLFSVAARSQVNRSGTPLITCFDAADTPGDMVNGCVVMDRRGVMYFGNESKSIVTYDGYNWGLISIPGQQRVNALASDYRGLVYVGTETDFGFLQPDQSGSLKFCSIADKLGDSTLRGEVGMIASVAADSNTVYFSDKNKIYLYGLKDDTLQVLDAGREYGLNSISLVMADNDKVFLADIRKGLYEYTDTSVIALAGGDALRMSTVIAMLPYDSDNLLLATVEKGLLLFNYRTGILNSQFIDPVVNGRLTDEAISSAVILPGRNIAVGVSGGGGVYIFNHEGLLQQQISDQTSELRESTVTAMYCDYATNSQLWFCTIGYINRAYVTMPAYEFGAGTGILTVVGDIVQFGDSVYVASDQGILKNYMDSEGIVRFNKAEGPVSRVFDLQKQVISGDTLLLAAASDGLWQLEQGNSFSRVLVSTSLTVVKTDRYDPAIAVTGSSDGMVETLRRQQGEWKVINSTGKNKFQGRIAEMEQTAPGEWWILTTEPAVLTRMTCTRSDTAYLRYDRTRGVECDTMTALSVIDDKVYLSTGRGVYSYNADTDLFEKDHDLIGRSFDGLRINNLFKTPEGDIYVSGFDKNYFDAIVTPTRQGHVVFRKQFDFLPEVASSGIAFIDNNIWITKGRNIFVLDKSRLGFSYGAFKTIFTFIESGGRELLNNSFYTISRSGVYVPSASQPAGTSPELSHENNSLTFSWTTTSYVGEAKTEYMYRLENLDTDWSKWEIRNFRDYTNLRPGDYVFRLKAKTITGLESEEQTYSFSVVKPWYTTIVALSLYCAAILLLILLAVMLQSRRMKARKKRLENRLREMMKEAEKGKADMDNLIKYAGIVQRALMPAEGILAYAVPNSFILNMPRDSVSGDFYWMGIKGDRFLIAAGDCTGHGVGSAMTTMMGLSFLDEAFYRRSDISASEILNELKNKLSASPGKAEKSDEHPETMDIALLSLDRSNNSVGFSAAGAQCFRVRQLEENEMLAWESGKLETEEGTQTDGKYLIETISGDRFPLGVQRRIDQELTLQEWDLEKETSYYLFTDGYSDQFNGNTGRKFMKRNFRNLILGIQNYPMAKQKEMLEERLMTWKGSASQTDDILIIGFKIE